MTCEVSDVLIIGGGAAGLACARELHRRQRAVRLLEATNRIGGRTCSRRDLIPNAVVEFGAESVGGNHPRWWRYSNSLGFALEEVVWPDFEVCRLDGENYRGAELEQLSRECSRLTEQMEMLARHVNLDRPWETPDAVFLDARSLSAGIDELEGTGRAKRFLKHRFEFSESASPEAISWLGQLTIIKGHDLHRYWEETERYRCLGGVATLCEKLAGALPDGIVQTGSPVVAVRYDSRGGEVEVAEGPRFAADWIVLAVPPSQWPMIQFDPPLPPKLNLALGAASKEVCDFGPEPWAPAEGPLGRSDAPPGVVWTGHGPAVATRFVAGPTAKLVSRQDAQVRQAETRELFDRHTSTAGKLWRARHIRDWVNEPFIGGGYSCAQIGKATQLGELLTRGIDRLLFAGEHCSFSFTGYVEGALESGERASYAILK